MLETILFTHNDLDGAGCRVIFELAHTHLTKGEEFDVINCSNNNIDQKVNDMLDSGLISENTWVCFADICPSREVLESIAKKFPNIDIWDHHRSNFFATWIVPDARIIPESPIRNECGTSIMFQWFCALAYSNPRDYRGYFFRDDNGNSRLLSEFVENVRLRDTWDWKLTNDPKPKMLNSLLFLLGMDRFCNRYIDRIKDTNSTSDLILPTDMEFVEAKIEIGQRAIDNFSIDKLKMIEWNGYRAGLSFGVFGTNVSDLADSVLEQHPEIDIFVNFSLAGSGTFEFRCKKDDIDISKFASDLGGGGHADASGAPIPQMIKDMITDIIEAYLNGEKFIIGEEETDGQEKDQGDEANSDATGSIKEGENQGS